jgi:hypothetical protein
LLCSPLFVLLVLEKAAVLGVTSGVGFGLLHLAELGRRK